MERVFLAIAMSAAIGYFLNCVFSQVAQAFTF